MRLRDLIEMMQRLDLGEQGSPRRPPRENLDSLRDALGAGLADPDFRLDCIEHDLRAWREWELSGWSGMKPPIATLPDLGIFVMMFYWPPGEVSPPHEHTSWTMSAVFHHRLEVMTYHWERAVADRRLETRSLFTAEAGRVGYIYDPAIHSPRNPSTGGATSFHIYNSDDGPVLEREVGPIDGLVSYDKSSDDDVPARPPELFIGARREVLRAHAEVARRFPCARSDETLRTLQRALDLDPTGPAI